MTRISLAMGWLSFVLVVGCGGSSTSDDGTGGTSTGGTSSGGASSGGASSGGASSGGASSGGASSGGASSGGASSGGTAGTNACGPEASACTKPSDCVLNTPSCCLCGMPEITDFEAINSSFVEECSCQGPACGCATQENPNLAATCQAGSCQGFDVRQEEYSACNIDQDCTLRNGLGCCEGCQGSEFNVVAVNVNQSALTDALCGSELVGCPDCIIQYPANKKAVCVSNHCQVADK